MLNKARLSVAVEQVATQAKEAGLTPLEACAGFDKGNDTQKQIYDAVKAKYPEKKNGNA